MELEKLKQIQSFQYQNSELGTVAREIIGFFLLLPQKKSGFTTAYSLDRSSHWMCSIIKCVLKNFTEFNEHPDVHSPSAESSRVQASIVQASRGPESKDPKSRRPLNYVIFLFDSNQSVKVALLQKLTNQSMLNGTLVIKILLMKARTTLVV